MKGGLFDIEAIAKVKDRTYECGIITKTLGSPGLISKLLRETQGFILFTLTCGAGAVLLLQRGQQHSYFGGPFLRLCSCLQISSHLNQCDGVPDLLRLQKW